MGNRHVLRQSRSVARLTCSLAFVTEVEGALVKRAQAWGQRT